MELYKKYRPNCLDDIEGNENTIKTIKRMKEFPHAILLTGPRGCGKTTLSRILAERVGARGMDFVEMDSVVYRSVDTIRSIRKNLPFRPVASDARVWCLDEAHMVGVGGDSSKNVAQSALLKALEEAPDHVYFILCTTNPEMLLGTIRSRCTIFNMTALDDDEMENLLVKIARKEKKKVPDNIISAIVDEAQGHPRDALTILGKVLLHKNKKDMLASINEAIGDEAEVKELCQALLKGHTWKQVSKLLSKLESIPHETIRRTILGYMSKVILNNKKANSFSENAWYVMSWFYEKNTFDNGFAGIVFCCFAITKGVEGPY